MKQAASQALALPTVGDFLPSYSRAFTFPASSQLLPLVPKILQETLRQGSANFACA